jgi:hypothetical protein
MVPGDPVSATAAANTAVVITIAGVAGQAICINALSASYSVAVAGGLLTIVVNGVTIYQIDITAIGPVTIPLPDSGIECALGQNAVITLAAGGATAIGKLNVASYMGV